LKRRPGFPGTFWSDSMKLFWVAILTLFAGSVGHSTAGPDRAEGSQAVESSIRRALTAPGQPRSRVRLFEEVPSTPPWSTLTLEEFAPPEFDETWTLDFAALTSIPVAWYSWARPCSSMEDPSQTRSHLLLILDIPLRC
jgi:hypothetical protein